MAEPFRRLVKLVGRAFYDDEMGPAPGKSNKCDNRGIAVVVLDALTRRQWVKEEDLAKILKLHPKQLRRTLRVLEEEQLVLREDHKETSKGSKAYNAAVAATNDGQTATENDEKTKVLITSYWCLDFAQVCDVVRYRIHRAKKKIKDQLDDRNTVQEYVCPNATCARRYSALDASRLISAMDMNFHCERCDSELVAESDKIAAAEFGGGDGEENARRRHREKLKEMLERMEVQLKPLYDHLAKLKDCTPPDYGSFAQWQKRAIISGKAAASDAGNDQNKNANGHNTGSTMPFMGETKVEVALAGAEDAEQAVKEESGTATKILPPWMIREGMNLTAQQRGDVVKSDPDANTSQSSKPAIDQKEVKPQQEANPEQKRQAEYLKAYYAAYQKQQQETLQSQSPDAHHTSAAAAAAADNDDDDDDIGDDDSKRKREEDNEQEVEEIEWEDGEAATAVAAAEEAGASEDEIDWE